MGSMVFARRQGQFVVDRAQVVVLPAERSRDVEHVVELLAREEVAVAADHGTAGGAACQRELWCPKITQWS